MSSEQSPDIIKSEANGGDDTSKFYIEHAKDFVELHDQVEASVNLLDSLETFLATFQNDLSAVSGQISDLQSRSKEYDARLSGRKKIEKPLSNLISDLSIGPELTKLILDTPVGEPWIGAIEEFEQRLEAIKARARVKAARDMSDVAEGLRIVAATKLRAFFLSAMQPIRNNISTNMHVLQTSVFLKYRPLFAFLQRRAKSVAQELQRTYTGAARLYYETGFRRYTRSLGYIKARVIEKSTMIGNISSDPSAQEFMDPERLSYAKLDGPSVTLAYMADDRQHKEPTEALFRATLMVLMDNGSTEYAFISKFFQEPASIQTPSPLLRSPVFTPSNLNFGEDRPPTETATESVSPSRRTSAYLNPPPPATRDNDKEQRAMFDGMWKQIMDPAIQYCQTFIATTLDPPPPVVPLLTMIKLNQNALEESQKRECYPLETFLIGLKLQMWPIFQKEMNAHIESLKKLVDGSGGGLLTRGVVLKDSSIQLVAQRYTSLFTAFVALTGQEEEAMLFSSLVRLRQEVNRMITTQAAKHKDPARSAAYLSSTYEILLHNLSTGPHSTTHPKAQAEVAHWRQREEEARRRIVLSRR
ncbi:hypothetical protein FRC02_000298 [Tulasnella sp. 418]|nr:hypothetical protein FRC02_000298 [Tulasnella sp. 418]